MDASFLWIAGWVLLHGGALSVAWGTRVLAGSHAEFPMQAAFLFAMAAVGGTVSVCYQFESDLWILSAVTFVTMVLAAVSDFGHKSCSDSTTAVEAF